MSTYFQNCSSNKNWLVNFQISTLFFLEETCKWEVAKNKNCESAITDVNKKFETLVRGAHGSELSLSILEINTTIHDQDIWLNIVTRKLWNN
jgi:hypothetical protein